MDPPTGQPSLSPFSQPSTSPSSNTKTVIIAVLITVVITSLIVVIICFFYQKLRLRKQKPNSSPFNATPDNPLLDTRIRSHFWRFQGGTGNTVNGSPAVKQDSVLTPSIASKQNGNFGGNNHASDSIANLDSVSTWSVSSKQNDSFIANVQGSLPEVEGQLKMAGSQLELGNPEQVGRVGFQALSMPVSLTKTQELSNFGRLHKNNEALTACMPMAASLAPPSQKPVHGPEQSARFSDDSGEAGNDSADLTLGPFWMSSTEQQSHATVGSAVLHTLTTKTSHSVSSVNAFSLNAPLPEQQLAMATEVSVSEQSSLPMGHTLSEHRNSINAAQSLAETFGPLAAPPLHAASGELPFGSTATDSFTSKPWPVSERPSTTAPAAFNFTPQLVPPLPLPPALVSAAILNAQRQKSASLADKIHSSIPVKSVAAAFASQATETKVVSSSSVGEISSSIPVKSVAAAFASQSYQADTASSAFSAGEIHFSIPVKSAAAAFASSQASQAETTVLPSSFSLPYSSKQVTSSDTHFALSNTKMTTIYPSSFPPSSANALTSQASQPPQAISPLAFPDVTTGQSLIQPTASLTGVSHAPMDEARLPYDLVSTANASNAWQTSASFPEGALASSGKTTFTAPQSVTASLPNQHFQSYSAALTSVGLSQNPSQQLTFHGDSHFAVSASETDQPSALPFCPPYSAALAGENLEVSSVHTYNKIPPFHSVSTAPVEGAAELYPALVSQHIPSAGNVPPPPAPPPPPIMAQAVPHPKAASLSVGTKGSPPPPPPPPPPPTSHLPTVGTKGSPPPLPPPPLVSNSSSADVVPPLSNVKEPPPPPPLPSINGPPAPSLSSSKGPPAPPPHPLGTTKGPPPPPPPPPPLPFTKDPSAPPPPPLPIPKGPSSSPSLPSTKGPPPPPPPPLPSTKGPAPPPPPPLPSTKGHPAPPPPPNAKGPPPPPPPNAKGPPPPPPPNAKGPPPPPPLPGAKGPPRAPVPPPPPGSKGPPPPPAPFAPPAPPGSAPRPPHTSKPPQVPQQDLAQNVQKLKPLHWDKVRASHSMVWDKLKTGSFVLDEKEIETLFGTTANVKKEVGKSPAPAKRKAILDSKKAHFIAIQLRALNISTQDICDALLEGDGMKAELLEVLVKMSPTQEEQKALLDFSGDRSELGPAERFLKAVLEIPNAFQRLQAMQYKACFKDDLSQVQESLQILEAACVQVKENRLFLKLLEAVLKTGNRMNKGTNRGEAEAFKLDTLLKLSDVKSADGKTTLLHFVAEEIIKSEGLKAMHATNEGDPSTRKMPEGQKNEDDVKRRGLEVVLQLCTELGSVKKAAGVDADALSQSVLKLASGLLSIQNRLKTSFQVQAQLSGIFPTEDSFGARMEVFCSKAEDDVAKAKEDISRVFDKVKQATTYFHGNLKETQPLRLFMIVSDFLSILEKVCKDLAKPLKMNIRG